MFLLCLLVSVPYGFRCTDEYNLRYRTDNGSAFQQYIHWRYTTKSKVIDFASAPERYRYLVETVQKTDFPVEMAKLSARGITIYSVDGITRELPAEWKCYILDNDRTQISVNFQFYCYSRTFYFQ